MTCMFKYVTTAKSPLFLMPECAVSTAIYFNRLWIGKDPKKLNFYDSTYDRICIFEVRSNTKFKTCISLGTSK